MRCIEMCCSYWHLLEKNLSRKQNVLFSRTPVCKRVGLKFSAPRNLKQNILVSKRSIQVKTSGFYARLYFGFLVPPRMNHIHDSYSISVCVFGTILTRNWAIRLMGRHFSVAQFLKWKILDLQISKFFYSLLWRHRSIEWRHDDVIRRTKIILL